MTADNFKQLLDGAGSEIFLSDSLQARTNEKTKNDGKLANPGLHRKWPLKEVGIHYYQQFSIQLPL